jgi:hypothetical protein
MGITTAGSSGDETSTTGDRRFEWRRDVDLWRPRFTRDDESQR